MKILLTGNNGYIGTVMSKLLVEKEYSVTGLDVNYFETCLVNECVSIARIQTAKIRRIEYSMRDF